MTLERWYRHAAIVLWPDAHHFDVLCDCGRRSAVSGLEELIARQGKASKKSAAEIKAQCIEFAGKILARWASGDFPRDVAGWKENRYSQGEPDNIDLLPLLTQLDDPGLIGAYIGEVVAKDKLVEPDRSLPALCEKHGWATFSKEFHSVFENTTSATLDRNVRLLEQICLAKSRRNVAWSNLCDVLTHKTVSALEKIDGENVRDDWSAPPTKRSDLLAGLVRSLIAVEQDELASRVVSHALAVPKKFPLEAHIAALTKLKPWLSKHVKKRCDPLSQWLAWCGNRLEALTAQAPTEPTDFRRDANIPCTCRDCEELKRFLIDPVEKTHRFSMAEQRRKHLVYAISGPHCDVDHKTERTGSPHTLVCTKNTNSYQERLNKYKEDQKYLVLLRSIEASLPK
jgi:hypothetical protein